MKSIDSKLKKIITTAVLKKEPKFTTTCKICKMEFADPDRTKRHMIKAHSKPKRER
ncbi:MAG: hypothetical protein ACE5RI_09015 [Candidatus Nitrosomaritimum yanchengensis]